MKTINDTGLREIAERIESLSRRHTEQQATLMSIRQKLAKTREDDLNREALALSNNTENPKPKAPSVEKALKAAEHDAAVLERALEIAGVERGRYLAENATRLAAMLEDAMSRKAREVGELARPLLDALRAFYAVDEDAKVLKPYRQTLAESTDEARDMVTFIGVPQTTGNAFGTDKVAGLHRGELEGVLASLANLAASFPDRSGMDQERGDAA